MRRLTIHLSSTWVVSGRSQEGLTPERSRFETTKREAFHSLFAKFRLDVILASVSRMSLPGDVPVVRANRSASAP